jgi:hypothetical protein
MDKNLNAPRRRAGFFSPLAAAAVWGKHSPQAPPGSRVGQTFTASPTRQGEGFSAA